MRRNDVVLGGSSPNKGLNSSFTMSRLRTNSEMLYNESNN